MLFLPEHFQPISYLWVFLAGFIAAALNAVAGGGTLFSFPILHFVGLPLLSANMTNAVALVPGSLTGAIGYREYYSEIRTTLLRLAVPSLLGAACGSFLLLRTTEVSFQRWIPFLILFATLTLAFQAQIREIHDKSKLQINAVGGWIAQFLISVYGGYFGAGMGILMLGYMSLLLTSDIHGLNCLKGWLAVIINGVAAILFLATGKVYLLVCVTQMVGAILGGYLVARLALKVKPATIRMFVVTFGFVLTAYYFWKAFVV